MSALDKLRTFHREMLACVANKDIEKAHIEADAILSNMVHFLGMDYDRPGSGALQEQRLIRLTLAAYKRIERYFI